MKALIIDTETTGLDYKKDSIIEIAAVLADLDNQMILAQRASLIYAVTNQESEKITGITQDMLDYVKNSQDDPFNQIKIMSEHADCIIAHNAEFDKNFVEFLGYKFKNKKLESLEWVCSCYDIIYDRELENKKLSTIANAYSVNNSEAHRALTDVQMLLNILYKVSNINEQLNSILLDKKKPEYKIISLAPFDKKDEVKKAGFRWDCIKKHWFKKIRAKDDDEFINLVLGFNFKVKVLE